MDPAPQRLLTKFLAQLDATEHWLDIFFSSPQAPRRVLSLADSLRRYLALCRVRARRAKVSIAQLLRWRRKIEDACFLLWRAMQPED